VKEIPSDPSNVSEVTELLFWDISFQILCEETNLYYLQNHEKYGRYYKVLKWVDVTVAEIFVVVIIIIIIIYLLAIRNLHFFELICWLYSPLLL
jgi:hypothetical protein